MHVTTQISRMQFVKRIRIQHRQTAVHIHQIHFTVSRYR